MSPGLLWVSLVLAEQVLLVRPLGLSFSATWLWDSGKRHDLACGWSARSYILANPTWRYFEGKLAALQDPGKIPEEASAHLISFEKLRDCKGAEKFKMEWLLYGG